MDLMLAINYNDGHISKQKILDLFETSLNLISHESLLETINNIDKNKKACIHYFMQTTPNTDITINIKLIGILISKGALIAPKNSIFANPCHIILSIYNIKLLEYVFKTIKNQNKALFNIFLNKPNEFGKNILDLALERKKISEEHRSEYDIKIANSIIALIIDYGGAVNFYTTKQKSLKQ
jgi:hypothetical protein